MKCDRRRMQVEMRTQNRRAGCTSSSAAAFASPSALSSPLWNINPANVCANFGTKTSLLCAHFAFKPSHGLRCRAAVIRGIGMTASPSAADVMRGDEQDRIFRRVGTTSGDSTQESSEDVVKIVSYNVLGPKQALTDKHAYSHFKWRKWPYRRERIFEELRKYDADVVCLQEVTPDTFLNDFAPFMKELGLDKGIYTPKRLPDGEKSSTR